MSTWREREEGIRDRVRVRVRDRVKSKTSIKCFNRKAEIFG